MHTGDILQFSAFVIKGGGCTDWDEHARIENHHYATVIKIYQYSQGYWQCDIMWPDGTVDNIELHEDEFEVINETR